MVASGHPRHLAHKLDCNQKEWLPSRFDVVKRVEGTVALILLHAYRVPEVFRERVYNKCFIKVQSQHVTDQGARSHRARHTE